MAKILYTSGDVYSAIKHVLGEPKPNERRVVSVAYVGTAAEAYLPSPRGLELICSLEPVATSAIALERLRKRGATVFKSDRLHMKGKRPVKALLLA